MKNPNDKQLKRAMPFVVEFVKFSAGFSLIIAIALIAFNAISVGQY
jgi:hypothetical protein